MSAETLLSRLKGVRHVGNGRIMALCPAHKDGSPSLSHTVTDDGTILIYCHAGCSTEDVLDAVGLTFRDLYPDNPDRAAYRAATANRGRKFQRLFKADQLAEDKTVVRIAQQWVRDGKQLSLDDQARLDLALSRLEGKDVANG